MLVWVATEAFSPEEKTGVVVTCLIETRTATGNKYKSLVHAHLPKAVPRGWDKSKNVY